MLHLEVKLFRKILPSKTKKIHYYPCFHNSDRRTNLGTGCNTNIWYPIPIRNLIDACDVDFLSAIQLAAISTACRVDYIQTSALDCMKEELSRPTNFAQSVGRPKRLQAL